MTDSVLITGGAGFIGSTLARRLADDGYEVTILDNLYRGRREVAEALDELENVDFVRGDIRTQQTVQEAVAGKDAVVHLAAVCLNRSIDYPTESFEVNLVGTNNVLQASSTEDVDKVLAASSASVYGDQSIPMEETDFPQPQTPYGISKLALEYMLDFYAERGEFDTVAYRFFNVYGPGQHTDAYYTSVINVFIERLLEGKAPVIHGSGEQTMDFVHVEDVARALQLGLEADVSGEVVNVGSGEMTSISELAETLIDIVGADVTPTYEDREVIVSERRAATTHARETIGFETEISIEEGLSEVVDWVRQSQSDGER